jgi:hypothetical protein
MIAPMKSLWMLGVLAAGLTMGAGCGPQEEYCPNTGKNGVCPITGDDSRPPPMDDGGETSLCPTGQHLAPNPDGNIIGVCVPN